MRLEYRIHYSNNKLSILLKQYALKKNSERIHIRVSFYHLGLWRAFIVERATQKPLADMIILTSPHDNAWRNARIYISDGHLSMLYSWRWYWNCQIPSDQK